MIDLSADTRNLSSSSKKKELKQALSEMIDLVEFELEVNVEFLSGYGSYWVPTPEDEIEELDLFGIIEIGDDLSEFHKIVHLTHEAGHALYGRDDLFKNVKDTMFYESTAWYLGYHFMANHGYTINMEEYQAELEHALRLYRWSENVRDVE